MATLHITKMPYSVDPWRIGVQHPDGRFVQLSHFSFPRKRDAVPFLRRLEALGIAWDQPMEAWTEAQRQGAVQITNDTPSWQDLMALPKQSAW